MSDQPVLESAADLLPLVELTGIKTYEFRGRRHSPELDTSDAGEESMEVMARFEDGCIEARLRFEKRTDDAVFLADVSALYSMSQTMEIPEPVLHEFLERVGVMAVFPFIRESVITTAARLGVAIPVLGLLRSGGFKIGVNEPDEPVNEPDEPVVAE